MKPKVLMRTILTQAILLSGLPAVTRFLLWRDRVAVLLYHDPDPATLDAHLQYLKQYCDFIPMSEVNAPGKGRARAALTFDDGHVGNAALLPVFIKHGICPTIYICSSIVAHERTHWWLTPGAQRAGVKRLIKLPNAERLDELASHGFQQNARSNDAPVSGLSGEQIEAMLPYVDFQSHTRFHPTLTRLDDHECIEELAQSRQEVEQLTKAPCEHFAYPYGRYGSREVAMLKATGYKTGRTTAVGWNDESSDPFRLRAFDIEDDSSVSWFAAQMTGVPLAWRNLPLGTLKSALVRMINFSQIRKPRTNASNKPVI
jgi:peptidoglycan/xylan/chitin deacetylase (PgdA/CDA1 family)